LEAGLEDAAGADEVAWEAVNGGGYGEVGLGGFEGGFQGGGVRVEFGAEAGVASGEELPKQRMWKGWEEVGRGAWRLGIWPVTGGSVGWRVGGLAC